MNNCTFTGRLTEKPELRTTSSGKMVTSFCLAVKRDYKNADGSVDSDFINFTAWNQQADTITKWCDKGDELFVIGSLRARDYTDQNNNKRRAYEVEVKSFEFGRKVGEGKKSTEQPVQSNAPTAQNPAIIPGVNSTFSSPATAPAQNVVVTYDSSELEETDELPF